MPNVRRRSARARCDHDGVAVSFGERSGANASLVASPAHTRSQSAFCSSSVVKPATSVSRSVKKHGPARRRSRTASWTGSSGGSAAFGGGPISGASSRKYSATRPERRPSAPAPTHTTSPLAHSWSIHAGE